MPVKFKVKNQVISCTSHRFVAADSVNFLKAEFSFDGGWEGRAVTATFTNLDTGESRKALLDETRSCMIPHEALAGAGRLAVYAEGMCGDSVATTAMMEKPLPVKESGKAEAGESAPPTPDVYQQIMAQFNSFQEGESLAGKIADAVSSYLERNPLQGNGRGIKSVGIDGAGHLVVTLTDHSVVDAGLLPQGKQGVPGIQGEKGDKGEDGQDGEDGYTPSIEVGADTDREYRLNIVNKAGTITTPNLRNDSAPVGTVISYMGLAAPAGYLACDGAQYQAADYPLLAAHFKEQFKAANYFGGDGAATFAVPDLRGEFLRGAGEGARKTGAGSAAGVHQHPTEFPYTAVGASQNKLYLFRDGTAEYNECYYIDKAVRSSPLTGLDMGRGATYTPSHNLLRYTSRPTNTSVLWCIKYC